jgi:hypothetical protein
MPTPFSSIETAINAATTAALANATLTWGASSSADGVFREPSQALLGGLVDGGMPTFTALTSLVGAIAYGTAVAVGATSYTVAGNTPDGAGMTTLALQLAS